MTGLRIAFRPLERRDFALLAGWLTEPLVARWWNHEASAAALERDFGPALDGKEPTDLFLAERAGAGPFGLVQRYRIDAYPEYVAEITAVCPLPPRALSVDYLIGVAPERGRGTGTAMIAAFVADSWAAYPDSDDVVVPVAAGNRRSWRALERAGFARIAVGEMEPDNPVDPREHYVYRISRPPT